jgi:hypothetical protein
MKSSRVRGRWVALGLCSLGIGVGGAYGCGGDSADVETTVSVQPEAGSATMSAFDAGARARADAGSRSSEPAPPSSECPAPRVDLIERYPAWARNPETGDCCAYADEIVTPDNWPTFASESECQSSCRCADVEGTVFDGELIPITERTSLECRCALGDCPASPDAAADSLCMAGASVQQMTGCGLIVIARYEDLVGRAWAFEPTASDGGPTATLVGAYQYSDARSAPCDTGSWIAGRDGFNCAEAVTCQVCGSSSTPAPPCAPAGTGDAG